MVKILKTFWKVRKLVKRPKLRVKFILGRGNNIGDLRPGNPMLSFVQEDVSWKDKYGTPRFEASPQASLFVLGGLLQIFLELDVSDNFDEYRYWEQILWAIYYCGRPDWGAPLTRDDWEKAEETWPWLDIDLETRAKKNSWTHEFDL